MAAINSTQNTAVQALRSFDAVGQFLLQSEKISCWDGAYFYLNAMNLVGSHVRIAESFSDWQSSDDFADGPHCEVFGAKILGFQLIDGYGEPDPSYVVMPDGLDDVALISISRLLVVSSD